jgi:hypothetical protein
MSNGFASALKISAKYIRENDAVTARRLITERLQGMNHSDVREENTYLLNMAEGYKAVLTGLYTIAQRGES